MLLKPRYISHHRLHFFLYYICTYSRTKLYSNCIQIFLFVHFKVYAIVQNKYCYINVFLRIMILYLIALIDLFRYLLQIIIWKNGKNKIVFSLHNFLIPRAMPSDKFCAHFQNIDEYARIITQTSYTKYTKIFVFWSSSYSARYSLYLSMVYVMFVKSLRNLYTSFKFKMPDRQRLMIFPCKISCTTLNFTAVSILKSIQNKKN